MVQIKDEVKGVLDFISYVYKIFGFTFELKLSTVRLLSFESLIKFVISDFCLI